MTDCVFFTSTAYKLHMFKLHDFYTFRKKKLSPFFWYKAIFVWFSQFFYDSSSKLGYFEQKRWPETGSSPKTAGSQSVKASRYTILAHKTHMLYSVCSYWGPSSSAAKVEFDMNHDIFLCCVVALIFVRDMCNVHFLSSVNIDL